MAKSVSVAPVSIYQLKITLRDSKPPIWRRVQVADSITLHRLHLIIQAAMGWLDYHLHEFGIDGILYGVPDPEADVISELRVKLSALPLKEGFRFRYMYDFGDGWEHDILLEKVLPPEEGVRYPRCIAGRRNHPPEDVGGMWGYQNFLEAVRNREHPEHKAVIAWSGGQFDPEHFDLDETDFAVAHSGREYR